MSGTAAIVLAGGSGTRLGRAANKVYLPAGGRPLLAWSLAAFQHAPIIARIILVVRPVDRSHAHAVIEREPVPKLRQIVDGGLTRHGSERSGLEALASEIDSGETDLVCIHDAARPFPGQDLIARVVEGARRTGGAVPGLPLPDRVLLHCTGSDSPTLVPTGNLRRMQTPQAFRAAPLLAAFRAADRARFTGLDTAETAQRFGGLDVEVVEGDEDNLKVTFSDDLPVAQDLAAARSGVPYGHGG